VKAVKRREISCCASEMKARREGEGWWLRKDSVMKSGSVCHFRESLAGLSHGIMCSSGLELGSTWLIVEEVLLYQSEGEEKGKRRAI